MWGNTIRDVLFHVSFLTIWSLWIIHLALVIGGAVYYRKIKRAKPNPPLPEYPTVSIPVPAHNEALHRSMSQAEHPYGDGAAALRITEILKNSL